MSEGNLDGAVFPETPEKTSSIRLIGTLGGAGAVAGLLIVGVFSATLPAIEAHKAEVLRHAISEVLNGPASYETLYITPYGVFDSPPMAGTETDTEGVAQVAHFDTEKIYVGLDAKGQAMGVAIEAAAPGFQDVITLLYGFDPTTGRLLGMKVLDSKETPGLGDKIEKDETFVAQFENALPPLLAVKRATGAPGEIDAISGATISSRAVVRIINRSLERLRTPLEEHFQEPPP